jgi:hypothetical protein
LNAGLAPGVTNPVVHDPISRERGRQGKVLIAGTLLWKGYRGSTGIRLAHSYFTTSGRHEAYSGKARPGPDTVSLILWALSIASVGPNGTTAGCSASSRGAWYVCTVISMSLG